MEDKLVLSEEAKEIFRNMTEEQLDEASRQFAAMMNYQFEKMITEQYLGQRFDIVDYFKRIDGIDKKDENTD